MFSTIHLYRLGVFFFGGAEKARGWGWVGGPKVFLLVIDIYQRSVPLGWGRGERQRERGGRGRERGRREREREKQES